MAAGREPTERYGRLFVGLIGVLILAPFFTDGPLARVVLVTLVGFVVLASFSATGIRSKTAMIVPVVVAVATVVPAASAQGVAVEAAVLVVLAVGMALGPPNIVRRILETSTVTLQLVVAALCAYVQVGFAFAFAFAATDRIDPTAILGASADERFFDYVYFSFITMTTVGYGDLTPNTDLARSMAIVETLLGQIFLVVLVAYLVGNLSGRRAEQRRSSSD